MAEKGRLAVEYTKQSLDSASEIVTYLRMKFSPKEIEAFYQALEDFEKTIALYPALHNKSSKSTIRRAVLNKVLSVYYTSTAHKISIVDIHDNRWDFDKRMK